MATVPPYVDLDTIQRPANLDTLNPTWGAQVNDNFTNIYASVGVVATPPPWTPASLVNGWVNYTTYGAPAAYRQIGDIVYIRGLVDLGTQGLIYTLPAQLIPPYQVEFAMNNRTTSENTTPSELQSGIVQIYTNGQVTTNIYTSSVQASAACNFDGMFWSLTA